MPEVAVEIAMLAEEVIDGSCRLTSRRLDLVVVVVEGTTALAAPTRVDWPLNVTRAFWLTHEREALLKRERRTVSLSGMLKLVCEEEMSLGMASPRVAFMTEVELSWRAIVEQAP